MAQAKGFFDWKEKDTTISLIGRKGYLVSQWNWVAAQTDGGRGAYIPVLLGRYSFVVTLQITTEESGVVVVDQFLFIFIFLLLMNIRNKLKPVYWIQLAYTEKKEKKKWRWRRKKRSMCQEEFALQDTRYTKPTFVGSYEFRWYKCSWGGRRRFENGKRKKKILGIVVP